MSADLPKLYLARHGDTAWTDRFIPPLRQRVITGWFALNGFVVASWVAHIPRVSAALGVPHGALGLAAKAVAREAAAPIAASARDAVAARCRFVVAFSGGHMPWLMLRPLARQFPHLS